ncbi:hypothetical protein WMF30_32370 [Sorangium sp. So ce134]
MGGISVFSVMPHMHTIGKHLSSYMLPGDGGAPVDLGLADPWNFDGQIWYDKEGTLRGGDVVTTRCAWDNPGSSVVEFGERTSDEMCFNFMMYYPHQELGHRDTPAESSTCAPTK